MNRAELAPTLAGNAEVSIRGAIHLGTRLRVEEFIPAATQRPTFAALPEDGTIPPFEDPLPAGLPGQLPRQEMQYRLRDTPEDLHVRDSGLLMSYGIFGAPGSGKTHLMKRLLRQLVQLNADRDSQRFGALILDPKAALIEDVRAMAAAAGRSADVDVINAAELERENRSLNVIDVDMNAYELARALVLAAQSAGVGASEAYWFGAWQNLFGAAIYLMKWRSLEQLTLKALVDAVLSRATDRLIGDAGQRRIQTIADEARAHVGELPEEDRAEAVAAINQIDVFYGQKSDSVATVENLITNAYGAFLRAGTRRFSPLVPRTNATTPIYDRIIEEGRIVLVSVSPADPGLAKVLATLVKNLFMQSVLSRLDRVRQKRLRNFERPLVLACDEYALIASEVAGQFGDGYFFSVARQQGCAGLLATQSVNVLQATSMKENWKSVFSNFSAKVFMRAVDNETVEQATKLAGETDWATTSMSTSRGAQGPGSGMQRDLKERKALPAHFLTQLLKKGQGVVIGSLNGGDASSTYFVQVPGN